VRDTGLIRTAVRGRVPRTASEDHEERDLL
jgi:hypothetical protein